MSPLTALDAALAALLDGLEPVAPEAATPAAAIGFALAAPLRAPGPVPARATALRAGLAVAAQDLVGAAPGAPALFAAPPARVAAGEALPEGCDAV
ncbi:MAG: hypothetical protein JNK46_01610, partial [Methylobacteriaceae bacterium]|nr:hypothetical protein [Methylobacteriaceae bacterium]